MKIIPDKWISDLDWAKRPWKERLFTRPWRPWRRQKLVTSPRAYILGDTAYVSYATYLKIETIPGFKETLGIS